MIAINREPMSDGITMVMTRLHKEATEARIRLYGVLWLLVEQEIISEGKARELSTRPLREMIEECMSYREES